MLKDFKSFAICPSARSFLLLANILRSSAPRFDQQIQELYQIRMAAIQIIRSSHVLHLVPYFFQSVNLLLDQILFLFGPFLGIFFSFGFD